MITKKQIKQLTNTIIEVEQPDQIILFGSYAYGEPHEASDLDILVVEGVQSATPQTRDRSFEIVVVCAFSVRYCVLYASRNREMAPHTLSIYYNSHVKRQSYV